MSELSVSIPTSVVLCTWLSLLVCLLVPLGGYVALQIRRQHVSLSFLWGILTFLVASVLVRNIIIGILLPGLPGYAWLQANPWAMGLVYGLSAGILEECGRLIVLANFMPRNRRYVDGLAMGLGHAWLEAILVAGLGLVSNLAAFSAVQNGVHLQLEAEQAMEIVQAVQAITVQDTLLVAAERLMAMVMHVAFTLMLLNGLREGRPVRGLLLAVGAHSLVDSITSIIVAYLPLSTLALEGIVLAMTAPLGWYAFWVRRRFQELRRA